MADLLAKQIQNRGQNQAEQDTGSDGDIDLNIVPFEIKVSRKFSQPGDMNLEYQDQADNRQQDAQENEQLSNLGIHSQAQVSNIGTNLQHCKKRFRQSIERIGSSKPAAIDAIPLAPCLPGVPLLQAGLQQ